MGGSTLQLLRTRSSHRRLGVASSFAFTLCVDSLCCRLCHPSSTTVFRGRVRTRVGLNQREKGGGRDARQRAGRGVALEGRFGAEG